MADARIEQGEESRKMMDDQDRVPDNTSGSDMDIKLETSELLENCSTCGKGFQSKQDLIVHIRSTHLLQDSQCHFKSRKSLENHVNSVHKIVKCDSCNQNVLVPE